MDVQRTPQEVHDKSSRGVLRSHILNVWKFQQIKYCPGLISEPQTDTYHLNFPRVE